MNYTMKESNRNKQIGWIVCESAVDEETIQKPKLVDTNGRRVMAEAVFQRGNKKNRNGRFYDTKDLAAQIVCPRTMELLKTGFGCENGHPMSKDLVRQQTIDPNNVVAFITKLWMDGDFVKGFYRGSNLPIGEALDQNLRDGFCPAWSLRALGTIENTHRGSEVKGLKIITYDSVYYPSHPEAYTSKIVNESGNLLPSDPAISESEVMTKGLVAPIVNQQVIDYIQQESCNFKTICNEFEVFYDDIQLIDEGTKVQLSNSNTGNVFLVALESYIHNEIMDYCDTKW